MTAPRDKAQKGLRLLKEAILEELSRAGQPLTHAEIVSRLGIESEYDRGQWTVDGHGHRVS